MVLMMSFTRGIHTGRVGRSARNGASSQNQTPSPNSWASASAARTAARVSSA